MKECFPTSWTYDKEKDHVFCYLCSFHCKIKNGESGRCQIRKNIDNSLFVSNYGEMSLCIIDELKDRDISLLENEKSLTIGTYGCGNLCPFCENYYISHRTPERTFPYSNSIIDKLDDSVKYVSFSLSEPIVNLEFVMDVSQYVRKRGKKICIKTSGNMSRFMNHLLIKDVDVVSVDIKPLPLFDEKFIRNTLSFIRRAINAKKHVEINHIIIEGVNSSETEIKETIRRLKQVPFIGPLFSLTNIGIHLITHHANFHSPWGDTKSETMDMAKDIFSSFGFENVYVKE